MMMEHATGFTFPGMNELESDLPTPAPLHCYNEANAWSMV